MKALHLLFFLLWPVDTRTITWEDLKDVKFSRKFIKEEDMYFLFPTFGEKVKRLNGCEVQIKGYMIPVDPEGRIYVLSARPMASCFFCGAAGPETIIQLNLKTKKKVQNRCRVDGSGEIQAQLRQPQRMQLRAGCW